MQPLTLPLTLTIPNPNPTRYADTGYLMDGTKFDSSYEKGES